MPYLQTVVTHYINKQMPKLIFFISLLALLSCSDRKSKNKALEDFKDSINDETLSSSKPEKITSSKPEPVNVIKEINEPKFKDDSILVNGFLGLLILENYTEYEWVIKNADSSLFKSFDFGQPESRLYYEQLDSIISDFDLFAYKPDYGLLTIPSNISSDNYEIRSKSGEIKLIPISNKNFKFYTWAEFLLSDNYVSIKNSRWTGFEDELLKFYAEPNDSSEFIQYESKSAYEFTSAVDINGNWIKIKREFDSDTLKPVYGWTKWIENEKLLIDFWFLL